METLFFGLVILYARKKKKNGIQINCNKKPLFSLHKKKQQNAFIGHTLLLLPFLVTYTASFPHSCVAHLCDLDCLCLQHHGRPPAVLPAVGQLRGGIRVPSPATPSMPSCK